MPAHANQSQPAAADGSGKSTPLREQLLALPAAERAAALLAHLRAEVAQLLEVAPGSLAPNAPFIFLSPAWANPRVPVITLRSLVLKTLGMHVYPVEIAQRFTLAALAQYLAEELAPEWPAPEPVEELYEGGAWAWGEPRAHPAGALRLPGPLFILSAPRSGSTLLRTMLAGHPGLFSPPELNLLPFHSMGKRGKQADALGYSWIRSGPESALAELEALSPDEAAALTARMEQEELPVTEVYRRLQAGAGDQLLVDKSPLYACHPGWLGRSEQLFAGARYVCLVRHPYPVMESFVRMRFHRLLGSHWLVGDAHPWRLAEKVWTVCNRNVLEFLEGVEPARQHRVRYEELVSDPRSVLTALCDFLGLPFDEALLQPYAGERMTRVRLAPSVESPSIGDPNLLTRDRIDPELARTWQTLRPPQRLGGPARELAARLGYELCD